MSKERQIEIPALTVYEYLQTKSKAYAGQTAISFYGKTFSFEEFFLKIDEVACALTARGIGKDDIVASSLPGCPEGVFLIYATNKIGARYCAFDCRSREREIRQTIELFSPKICFVPDFQLKELCDVPNCTVVPINIVNSLSGLTRVGCSFANFFTGRTAFKVRHKYVISFDHFLKGGQGLTAPAAQKSTDDIFGYFYTSGTTYGRKSIILTNRNFNATAIQQKSAYETAMPGDFLLNFMPLFTCYSVALGLHLPLCAGVGVKLLPLIKTKHLKKILERERPNFVISVPAHWERFIKEDFTDCDLSFLKIAVVGGDTLGNERQERINDIFERCGAGRPLIIGYGLSETTSTATTAMLSNVKGSVGRPFAGTLLSIVDLQTGDPLPPNEKGEICISGPTVCKGYFKDDAMTAKLLKTHEDGRVWLHSGDLGYLDESGSLFFCERIKRMYVRFDGTKISPFSIEQAICACPEVERCMVVGVRDTEHANGMCAKALIEIKKTSKGKTAKPAIEKFICRHLDEHLRPREIVIVEKLPYTKNGKLDYFAPQEIATNT